MCLKQWLCYNILAWEVIVSFHAAQPWPVIDHWLESVDMEHMWFGKLPIDINKNDAPIECE